MLHHELNRIAQRSSFVRLPVTGGQFSFRVQIEGYSPVEEYIKLGDGLVRDDPSCDYPIFWEPEHLLLR